MVDRGPDFVCIGMEKAGTGWLYDQVAHATGAWMTPIKELNYFCGDPFTPFVLHRLDALKQRSDLGPKEREFVRVFESGRTRGKDAGWYRGIFAIKEGLVSGDVSPNYAMATPEEIRAALRECPDARYVMLLRHPVQRLWSAVCMRARKGQVPVQHLTDWARLAPVIATPEYTERSYPTRIWEKWSSAVPSGSLRHWFLEDIAREPSRVRDEILAYVGLPGAAVGIPPDYNRKKDQWKLPLPEGIRQRLLERFAGEIRECARVFGGRANAWREELEAALGTR